MANFALLQHQMQNTRKPDLEFAIGARVSCKGYDCDGIVRYYGPHLSKTRRVVYGIELDEAVGDNNGTVYEKKYFACDEGRGILLPPSNVAKSMTKKKKKSIRKAKKESLSGADNFETSGFGDDDLDDSGFADDDDNFGGFDDKDKDASFDAEGFGNEDEDDFDDDDFGGFGEEEEDVYVDDKFQENEGKSRPAIALFDFPGQEPEDLPFKKGEKLQVKDIGDEDWYSGINEEGKEGIIPADYVEIQA